MRQWFGQHETAGLWWHVATDISRGMGVKCHVHQSLVLGKNVISSSKQVPWEGCHCVVIIQFGSLPTFNILFPNEYPKV